MLENVVAAVVAALVPMRVMVPELFTSEVNEGLPVVPLVLLTTVKSLLPVTPPDKMVPTVAAVMPMVSVPAAVERSARTIGLANVSELVPKSSDAGLALRAVVSPKVTRPAPKALAEVRAFTVPALMLSPKFVTPS